MIGKEFNLDTINDGKDEAEVMQEHNNDEVQYLETNHLVTDNVEEKE